MDATLDSAAAADQLISYLYPHIGRTREGKTEDGWIGSLYIQSDVFIALCGRLRRARDRERNKVADALQRLKRGKE